MTSFLSRYIFLVILSTLFLLSVGNCCLDQSTFDLSCPADYYDLTYNQDSDTHYMLANYLRRTTQSLRVSSLLRSSSFSPSSSITSPQGTTKTSRTMSSSSANPSNEPQEQTKDGNSEPPSSNPQLALPERSEDDARQIDVSGQGSTVSLDHLGPIVVNQDGTLSRISNWDKMTEIERKNTMRIIGKRNKQRLDALKAAGVESEEGSSS